VILMSNLRCFGNIGGLTSLNVTRKFFWSILLITLLAFALRVFRLDAQSLWWDEIMPVLIAQLPFPQWFQPVFQDRGYPPGFYLLMTAWMQFGAGEFFARIVTVSFGTLTIPALARLGRRVGGDPVGIVAAVLMALSPFFIWYSQEMRMYAPLTFAAVASSWLFVELLHRPRVRIAVGLFAVNLFGMYTHYLFGIFLLAQFIFFAMARGRSPRALRLWFAATFGAGAFFVPWLVALQLVPIQGRPNLAWIPNAQWYDPALSLYHVLLGAAQDPNVFWNWMTPLLGLALAVYGVVKHWKTDARENTRYLLTWLLAPILFLFLLSIPIPQRSLYVDRYLTPYAPALLILIAMGAVALYRRQRVLLGIAALLALIPLGLSLANMYFVPRYARDDWRGMTNFLQQNADASREAVLLDLSLHLPFDLYQRDALTRIERPFSDQESVDAWAASSENFRGYPRVWLVTNAMPINVHRFYPDEAGQRAFAKQDAFKRAMDARYSVLQEKWFPGLMLTQYQVTP